MFFWNHSKIKKGYSGVAIYTIDQPRNVIYDLGIDHHDQEGRVITLEYDDYYLVNVYTPNAKRDLSRLDYRQAWDRDFLTHLKNLEKSKPVIFCGDLNVAHQEIDLANPKGNKGNAGFTDEERAGFNNMIDAGFIDTFREFNQDKGHYSWWSYMGRAREKNIGWRIDYFNISPSLKSSLKEAFIRPDIFGSDHCPVGITLKG
jgi:exodeoxyribonuclease-3